MKLEPFTADSESAARHGQARPAVRFTLERAPFAGQTFAVKFRVCPNPCCPCGVVGFACRAEAAPEQTVCFDLDVFDRQLTTKVQSAPDGLALGRAFLAEAQTEQWDWLGRFFNSVKRGQMETMDLDTLDAALPPDVKAGGSTMVGYREIFPWAETLSFTSDGEEWLADDHHCVQPGCTCTETGLSFFRLPAGGTGPAEPLRCLTFLFHDYANGKTRAMEARPDSPTTEQLMQALRAAHPDLGPALRRRHGQLQQLGRRLLPKSRRRSKRPFSYLWGDGMEEVESLLPAASAPAAPRSPQVGRNDPCPCGSGKKFKRCCGAI